MLVGLVHLDQDCRLLAGREPDLGGRVESLPERTSYLKIDSHSVEDVKEGSIEGGQHINLFLTVVHAVVLPHLLFRHSLSQLLSCILH